MPDRAGPPRQMPQGGDANIIARRTRLWQRVSLWAPLILALVAYGVAARLLLQRIIFEGDEPHFLTIAHSLCYDHDIDLKNNYEAQDYLSFYPYPTLDPHARDLRGDGTLRPSHYIGLPIVLTLPYCLLGQTDWTRLEMAILAALASWSIFLLIRKWTGSETVAWLTWAAMALSSPLWTMAPQLYPDVVAVFGVAIALLLLSSPSLSTRQIAVLSIIAAGLPWLHFRLVTMSLVIFLAAAARLLRSRARWWQGVALFALPVFSGSLWLWSSYAWYGSFLPTAMWSFSSDVEGFSWPKWYVAVVDLILGRENGLLTYAPIYWIALVGFVAMALRRDKAVLIPGLGLISYVFLLSLSAVTYQTGQAFAFPARFLLPTVPLLAIPFAYAIRHHRWLRIVGSGLLLVSVVIGIQSLVNPYSVMGDQDGFSELPFLDRLQLAYPALQLAPPSIDIDLAKMHQETGELVYAEGKPHAIRARPGIDEPGFMAFGPYLRLPTGQYTATFSLNSAPVDPSTLVARIDVAANQGKRILAQQDIYARDFVTGDGYQPFSLSFPVGDASKLEFRVYFAGQVKLRLQAIQIRPQASSAPPTYPGLPLTMAWGASVIIAGAIAANRERRNLPTQAQAGGSQSGKEQAGLDAG